jgi:hypothetical protein
VHRHHSLERTILSATRPERRTSEGENRDQLQAWIGLRCPHCSITQLSHLSPTVTKCRRSSNIDQNGAQSPYKPRTGSRRPPYPRSLRGSSDAAPSRRTVPESGEINVMAHRILTHRMSCMPRRIPPLEQEVHDP